jgi:capsule polysaccharide export protein KpsE/RkpR
MISTDPIVARHEETEPLRPRPWVRRVEIGWAKRRTVLQAALCGLLLSTAIAFLIPKQYESTTRIMPPEQGMNPAMLAALSGRMMPGNLGALAGSFLGIRNSAEIFAELLQSRSVRERIVDRFDLQKLYRNRYRQDSIKKLGKRTDVTEDRKTGIITLVVTDTDRRRARDMAQAYLDELNTLVARVNTSAASRERLFVEQRLVSVRSDLHDAEAQLSSFSSKNATLDVKEQTKAMVDATAKLEGELIVARSELSSLDQIYGPENVRVRAARARVSQLDQEMNQATGYGKAAAVPETPPYPSLRAIPALAVQWTDLYRRVKTQETIFELLTQEYEMARIEEAKSTANIGVIDAPSWPERKSFPPRLFIMLGGMLLSAVGCFVVVVRRAEWSALAEHDPRKQLFTGMIFDLRRDHLSWFSLRRAQNNGHQH